MSNEQTLDYLFLKEISQRVKDVVRSMSDDEIKALIKECVKDKIESSVDFYSVGDYIEEVLEENKDFIKRMVFNGLQNRLGC